MQNPEAPLPRFPSPLPPLLPLPPAPPAQPPNHPQTTTVRGLRGPIATMHARMETLVTVYFESALEARKLEVALEVMAFYPDLWPQTTLNRTQEKLLFVQGRAEAAGTRISILQAEICDKEFEFSMLMARRGVALPDRREGVGEIDEGHGQDVRGEGAVDEEQVAGADRAGLAGAEDQMDESDEEEEEEEEEDTGSGDGLGDDLLDEADDFWYVQSG